MKSLFFLFSCVLLLGWITVYSLGYTSNYSDHNYDLKSGDIVFQSTQGFQATAVQNATSSPYSHVGIMWIDKDHSEWVLEAVQPVKLTPLDEFRARSRGEFTALRLENEEVLSKEILEKMQRYGSEKIGKNYDFRFRWSDRSFYCSELVWKIYKNAANIELCEPRSFFDYNLDHPTVRDIIKRRYGSKGNLPKDEPVVAPADIARSSLLVSVPIKD